MANESELIKEEFPITILHSSQQEDGENWITGDVIKRWTDNPQGVSPEYPYEFVCTRYYTFKNNNTSTTANSLKKGWLPWDIKNISLWSHYGMNASPYQLLLGNPYESIYAIEASGNTRDAYVILDGDGVSTGEITLQGGNENSKGTYDLKIDKLYIVDLNNIEHSFNNSDYLTIDLGDNWNCRFLLSDKNGNPIINMVGIGPNPTNKITGDDLPDTIELNSSDSCFRCNLEGKYQKKIAIKAVNLEKNVSIVTSWTITAIRDKNGDGIWRYRIMPNIDRVVRTSYFKKISDSLSNLINTVYNIGDADSVKFDIEKDTYGKAWRDITNQACRVVIKNLHGGEAIKIPADGGPITVPFTELQSVVDAMADASPTLTLTSQYTVELQVVDPDYEATSEGYSVVDKCNLLFEYIVCEAGKDGEDGADGADGKNGVSTMFNLSNDNGTFAYDYHTGKITVNDKDDSTEIQYSEDSNYVCCTSLTIGGEPYSESTSEGVYDKVHFSLVKGEKFWTLTVDSIDGDGDGDSSTYTQLFSLPIKGFKDGKEVGSATFKMSGVKDLNEDGVYLYRLIPEHQHSSLNSASGDTLNVDVYRDELITGGGYSKEIPILVEVISKNKKENSTLGVVGGEDTKVSCTAPIINLDTLVSMKTVLDEMGVILKVYAKDPDYVDRAEFVNTDYPTYSGQGYYYTGEYEEVSWTAPAGSSSEITNEQITSAIKTIVCNNDNIVVIPGKEYTFKFKNIAGKNITGVTFENLGDYFENTSSSETYKLTAKTNFPSTSLVGTITYKADGYNSGEITYTWVGDSNSDGVYYDYEIEPSALVLGYTLGEDGNLAFNVGEITITCKSVRHKKKLKTQTAGSGFIVINNIAKNSKELDVNGLVKIPIGSTEGFHYEGTESFRVHWYTKDDDYKAAVDGGNKDIPTIVIKEETYYQVDSELIDVVPNTAIDATVNLQAYTGSGTFIVDPKALTATFEYKSDAPGYYLVRFNKALYEGTGDIYFADTTNKNTNETVVKVIMGPKSMQTSADGPNLACTGLEGPYGQGNYSDKVGESSIAWIKCPSVHVGIYKENTFKTLLFEDTVVRTGLDGYYWDVDEAGLVSLQSNGDVMTSINQTANSIVSIASGVSPNLCKGAATNKTSLFTWVKGESGLVVSSSEYNNSQIITPPSTDCEAGTGLLVSTSTSSGTTLYTYSAPDFKLNEGYYGISLSPTIPTTGNITVTYDGNLIIENSNTPSGSAILITSTYNGKGIKFTVDKALIGSAYILSFYASLEVGTIYIKANNTKYELAATGSMKRYIIKLDNLSSKDVIIYKDSSISTLQISSILFEKGSLVTDWKDYGLDVSSIILDASNIRSEVESIKDNYATKSYVNETARGIDMATVVNGIRTAGINIKNGDNNVTDGKIEEGSGSVELTGQVIATNFMVKKGSSRLDEMRRDNNIVMCITTWGNAQTLGTNETILNSTLSDDSPVFVIKSRNKYFVLNPLLLTNSDGKYPAIYTDFSVYRYTDSSYMDVNLLTSNTTDPEIIYRYDKPSYKLEGDSESWLIIEAENYLGRMCTDKDFDNKDRIDTNKLLLGFTLSCIGTINAPIYLYDDTNSSKEILFIDMQIYKFKKYLLGAVSEAKNVYVGPNVYFEQSGSYKDIRISKTTKTIYELIDINSSKYKGPSNRTTKSINHDAISDCSVSFEYIPTYPIGGGNPEVFITKINNDLEFNYIFLKVSSERVLLQTFLTNYGHSELSILNDSTIEEYKGKGIDLTYEAFIQGDDVQSILEHYNFLE